MTHLIDTTALTTSTITGEITTAVQSGAESYYTVVIPYTEVGQTQWHPRSPVGPFSPLTRGAFKTPELAHAWAAEHLNGTAYSLDFCEGCYWACDVYEDSDMATLRYRAALEADPETRDAYFRAA